ncbi:hypothetical protein GGS21DRAFT_498241 [Xylaria nigripes]|nr:hypothetical protein GGS21DRAFT_498241 [Xylaria nigripes]
MTSYIYLPIWWLLQLSRSWSRSKENLFSVHTAESGKRYPARNTSEPLLYVRYLHGAYCAALTLWMLGIPKLLGWTPSLVDTGTQYDSTQVVGR